MAKGKQVSRRSNNRWMNAVGSAWRGTTAAAGTLGTYAWNNRNRIVRAAAKYVKGQPGHKPDKKKYKTYKKITKRASGNEIAYNTFKTNKRPSPASKTIKIMDNCSITRQIDPLFLGAAIGTQNAITQTYAAWEGTWGNILFTQAAQSYQAYNGVEHTFDNMIDTPQYYSQKFFLQSCVNTLRLVNEQASVCEVEVYNL